MGWIVSVGFVFIAAALCGVADKEDTPVGLARASWGVRPGVVCHHGGVGMRSKRAIVQWREEGKIEKRARDRRPIRARR